MKCIPVKSYFGNMAYGSLKVPENKMVISLSSPLKKPIPPKIGPANKT
jgi:hypothetical protein